MNLLLNLCVFLVIVFPLCASLNTEEENLYNQIKAHQRNSTILNARNAPLHETILSVKEAEAILRNKENFKDGVTLDMIAKLYSALDVKVYGLRERAPKVDFSFINLTLFHRYEDVYPVGKKLPLFFSNNGPASAQLLKEPPTNHATNDQLQCGDPAVPKMDAACVYSFQSMFEFVTSSIGSRKVIPISANAGRWQLYTIVDTPKTMAHQPVAGCHKMSYLPYAMYSCHKVQNSIARVVPIVGDHDGTRMDAVSVCHMDTRSWSADHIAFQVLGIKPGFVPVCHFLSTDDIMWLGN
ncbi:BURP domain protein USPL1-like [Apium graveolens]|uniref:BURP domain protein USPL1-like n=2 Tax=Apium graveolens TaxID=4045 RepID=UPI003D7B131A